MAEEKDPKEDPKDKVIKEEIKKAGNAVEPEDKEALAKIRRRTGAGKTGNGQGRKGRG